MVSSRRSSCRQRTVVFAGCTFTSIAFGGKLTLSSTNQAAADAFVKALAAAPAADSALPHEEYVACSRRRSAGFSTGRPFTNRYSGLVGRSFCCPVPVTYSRSLAKPIKALDANTVVRTPDYFDAPQQNAGVKQKRTEEGEAEHISILERDESVRETCTEQCADGAECWMLRVADMNGSIL